MFTTVKLVASYQWHWSNLWNKWDKVTQDEADVKDLVAVVTGSNCGTLMYLRMVLKHA